MLLAALISMNLFYFLVKNIQSACAGFGRSWISLISPITHTHTHLCTRLPSQQKSNER